MTSEEIDHERTEPLASKRDGVLDAVPIAGQHSDPDHTIELDRDAPAANHGGGRHERAP